MGSGAIGAMVGGHGAASQGVLADAHMEGATSLEMRQQRVPGCTARDRNFHGCDDASVYDDTALKSYAGCTVTSAPAVTERW
jgi:hypothetical protein